MAYISLRKGSIRISAVATHIMQTRKAKLACHLMVWPGFKLNKSIAYPIYVWGKKPVWTSSDEQFLGKAAAFISG